MSFSKPTQNLVLPYAVQKRLNEMFAGSTGFSGPEMVDYFSGLDVNVEQYSWGGGMPGRKQMFEDLLARFSRERQLEIVAELTEVETFGKYKPPSGADRQFIREWLSSQGFVGKAPLSVVQGSPAQPTNASDSSSWDVFISHASEDKESFARPLANTLLAKGVKVWFDEFTLKIGDSLRQSIDRGLSSSKFGIVILSPAFFAKHWPQRELDGLVAREVGGGKVILPVWHQISAAEICTYSPMLADRLAASSSDGLDRVVAQLLTVVLPCSTAE